MDKFVNPKTAASALVVFAAVFFSLLVFMRSGKEIPPAGNDFSYSETQPTVPFDYKQPVSGDEELLWERINELSREDGSSSATGTEGTALSEEFIERDSDADGVRDWEEVLRQTDPYTPDAPASSAEGTTITEAPTTPVPSSEEPPATLPPEETKSEEKPAVPEKTEPKITALSPVTGPIGTVLTITGENFSLTNNTVYTGYTVLRNVSSPDGKTITLTVNPELPERADLVDIPFDYRFYVKNDAGVSNAGRFRLEVPPPPNNAKTFLQNLSVKMSRLALAYAYPLFQKNTAYALTAPGFGGRSLFVWYCTCSGGLVHTIGPPRGGNLLYTGGTRTYKYYQEFYAGPNHLGTYFPGAVCLFVAGPTCAGYPASGTMIMDGTSLI